MDDIFLTVTEAARILNRSGEGVRNYERRGILPASKTARGVRLFRRLDGRAVGWLEAEIQEWLQQQIEASRKVKA